MKITFPRNKYVTVYELAREGHSKRVIADMLPLNATNVLECFKHDTALQEAYARGRHWRQKAKRMHDYVCGVLTGEAKKVWNRLESLSKKKRSSGVEIRKLFANRGQQFKQTIFMHAMVSTDFHLNRSLQMVGVSKKEYDSWTASGEFARVLDELRFYRDNFIEGAVFSKIADGDSSMVKFAAQAQLKDRGYGKESKVTFQGSMQHNHNHTLNLDAILDRVSPSAKREILSAMRDNQNVIEGNVRSEQAMLPSLSIDSRPKAMASN